MTSFNNGNNNSAGNNNGRGNALYARRSLRVIDPESDVSFLFVPPIPPHVQLSIYIILSIIIHAHPWIRLLSSSIL